MPNITPYIRAQYPTIEGNDRVYFDNEFRKIQECFRGVLGALVANTQEIIIASGIVSLEAASNPIIYLVVDTEAAGASDDLVTINGGKQGQVLVIRAITDTRTVVVKDATGNVFLAGDMTLDNGQDTLTCFNVDGSNWIELARSNNAA